MTSVDAAATSSLDHGVFGATSAAVKAAAVVLVVAVMAVTAIEVAPAVTDLVRLPGQLDHGLGSVRHYNASMARVVELENVVIAELAALDDAGMAVAKVGPSVANLDAQLRAVAEGVETATRGPLAASNSAVAQLVVSLGALERQVQALGAPVAGAAAAIGDARHALDALLGAAQPLAAEVNRARQAGHSAAANAVGP